MKRTQTAPNRPRFKKRISFDIDDRSFWSDLTSYRKREGRTIRWIALQGMRSILKKTA